MNIYEKREEYIDTILTKKGKQIYENFLEFLIKTYYQEVKYPYNLPKNIFGIPDIQPLKTINSKEELKGRIKSYMMLLGLREFEIDVRGMIMYISVEEIDEDKNGN